MSVPMPAHRFGYCSSVVSFEVRKYETHDFVLFKIILAFQGLLGFHRNFRVDFSIPAKDIMEIFVAISGNL